MHRVFIGDTKVNRAYLEPYLYLRERVQQVTVKGVVYPVIVNLAGSLETYLGTRKTSSRAALKTLLIGFRRFGLCHPLQPEVEAKVSEQLNLTYPTRAWGFKWVADDQIHRPTKQVGVSAPGNRKNDGLRLSMFAKTFYRHLRKSSLPVPDLSDTNHAFEIVVNPDKTIREWLNASGTWFSQNVADNVLVALVKAGLLTRLDPDELHQVEELMDVSSAVNIWRIRQLPESDLGRIKMKKPSRPDPLTISQSTCYEVMATSLQLLDPRDKAVRPIAEAIKILERAFDEPLGAADITNLESLSLSLPTPASPNGKTGIVILAARQALEDFFSVHKKFASQS